MSATSRDRVRTCSASQALPRVLIHVAGGLVQAVYASTLVDIHIYNQDIDIASPAVEAARSTMDAEQFAQKRRGLQQFY